MSTDELAEWIEPLRELSRSSRSAYVVFNNNGRSASPTPAAQASLMDDDEPATRWIAQAPENARMLRQLLEDAGYRSVEDIMKEDEDKLAIKTGLGIKKARALKQGGEYFLQNEWKQIDAARKAAAASAQ